MRNSQRTSLVRLFKQVSRHYGEVGIQYYTVHSWSQPSLGRGTLKDDKLPRCKLSSRSSHTKLFCIYCGRTGPVPVSEVLKYCKTNNVHVSHSLREVRRTAFDCCFNMLISHNNDTALYTSNCLSRSYSRITHSIAVLTVHPASDPPLDAGDRRTPKC